MKPNQWLSRVIQNERGFRNLVQNYHPASHPRQPAKLPITAPNAQLACNAVSAQIAVQTKVPPIQAFDHAIQSSDTKTLFSLFSDTWFGVPESTSCWGIPCFAMLVDLIDDPPEEDELDKNPEAA